MIKNAKPMRVLMTADSVGGVWNYAMALSGGLIRLGCEVHLVVFGGSLSPAQRRTARACPDLRLTESQLRLEWMRDPWDDIARANELLRGIAAEFSPDVIHFNSYAPAAETWDRPVIVGAHSSLSGWWEAVRAGELLPEFRECCERTAAALSRASVVVAPTAAMLTELNRHFGIGFAGEVIPNGVDPLPRSTGPKRRRILSVGRIWDEAKNIRLLDSVATEVLWPISVAGPLAGPDGVELHPQHLECLGILSAEGVREELAGASIYAAPALYEPFGLAIQEAALSECALVLSDIPTLRELWHGAAVFVDPDDETAWRMALNDLIEDPRRRAVLASRALDRARSRGVAGMAMRYQALYARMLSEGDSQPRRLAA